MLINASFPSVFGHAHSPSSFFLLHKLPHLIRLTARIFTRPSFYFSFTAHGCGPICQVSPSSATQGSFSWSPSPVKVFPQHPVSRA